jgi:hypothetical protein
MPRSFCTDCRANRREFELFTCGTKGTQEVELMQGVHHSHHCGLAAGQYLPLFVIIIRETLISKHSVGSLA